MRAIWLLLVLAGAAQAQSWPTRPIQVIVNVAPAGTADVTARLLAPRLSQALGQPVLVDNRGGGDGYVGLDAVARAEPDGHTLLYSPGGPQGFDSLAVDGDGHVCVATLVNAGISVVDGESGELISFVQTEGEILTTNICFGGDDLKTAYLTLSGTGRLASVDWDWPGLELAHSA